MKEKINEAVKRMRMLGLYEPIISEFKKNQKLYYSEPTPLGGILYWVSNNPEWEAEIKDFERENNVLVYHAIHNHTGFGETLSCLYISDDSEEWEYDREDIADEDEKYPFVYVMNLSEPAFSEFGSIGIKSLAGGLVRTY